MELMSEQKLSSDGNPFSGLWQAHKLPLAFGLLSALALAFSAYLLLNIPRSAEISFSSDQQSESTTAAKTNQFIYVDLEGAVVRPGVIKMLSGSRIEEAITQAGGLSAEADIEAIARTVNRAAKLIDGAKLYFPKKGTSVMPMTQPAGEISSLVNINTASQTELEFLSGIGPVTAGKIISNRPYQVLEELVSKKVLSQSLFEKLKSQLAL